MSGRPSDLLSFASLLRQNQRECRRLERLMFRHKPLPADLAEEQMLNRPDASLRIDLARALESLPAHHL